VHVELPPRLDVVGSPRQLCQVVLNLLMNGLQALPGAGKVEVSARVKAGRVEVAVRDSGAGMDEATRQRLFEPFFSTKGRGGLGLGLSVVYGIVKAHGGTIEVESVLGRGTCFRFRLPSASAAPAAALGLASSSAPSAATTVPTAATAAATAPTATTAPA
jgi:signal transduction histidine kinase